jgi:putative transposase
MGNHVHLLAVPRDESSLARAIGLANMVYTHYLSRRLGNSGRVWQNRFFSCAVEKETYVWSVARYIERSGKGGRLDNHSRSRQ